MPHVVEEHITDARMTQSGLGGCGFTSAQVAEAGENCYVDWIGSSFTDPGGDWNEFQLKDAAGNIVHKNRVDNY